MSQSSDVCIVGLKCFDLLSGARVPRYLGGIEKQLVSLAKGLAARGWRVSFVTYDHGQPDGLDFDGIKVYGSFDPGQGLPGLRFVFPRMTKLWCAMKTADAATYLQMGAGSETGRVAMGCKRIGGGRRRFLFCIASDGDCEAGLRQLGPFREKALYRYGLRQADTVVSQTRRQKTMILESFGIRSEIIPMPCTWFSEVEGRGNQAFPSSGAHILWVGRISEVKRLEWLLDVAERCSDLVFDVVGTPNAETEYFASLMRRAEAIPNVVMHGRVSDEELADLYSKAMALCCTSIIEGFPTTFLEAWSRGVPVVTTFDPDGMVAEYGLGYVADSVGDLVESVRRVVNSPAERQAKSDISKAYFLNNYASEAILPRFETLLREFAA